jgi:hypothetical protein
MAGIFSWLGALGATGKAVVVASAVVTGGAGGDQHPGRFAGSGSR